MKAVYFVGIHYANYQKTNISGRVGEGFKSTTVRVNEGQTKPILHNKSYRPK